MTHDRYSRLLKDLRISVTDRCNFRCTYCMPDDEYKWIARREILSFEEISRLARLFVALGVDKIRLTGGEPLLRRDIDRLIRQLAAIEGLHDLCLTTNGSLLADKAGRLAAAGLKRLNVSLDTLDAEKFARIRRRGDLRAVLDGLFAARASGFGSIKLNAVIERGVNEDDILPLVEFARTHGFTMRFIEFMDVGNANRWISEKMVAKREILEVIHARYPLREVGREQAAAPAVDYEFVDGGGSVGVIASVTEPFCGDCTRARLTADGHLVTCLFAERGHDLKGLLRRGATDDEIREFITGVWSRRDDRYSDERLEAMQSPDGYEARSHRKLEMITLGG
ncbi:MAG TPA: GTP 3',8-cyclase MoaA [Blastocatellia bacterium]|nr:GTP 3',8-cyclase MoaA [Blastocatellia bacterium]